MQMLYGHQAGEQVGPDGLISIQHNAGTTTRAIQITPIGATQYAPALITVSAYTNNNFTIRVANKRSADGCFSWAYGSQATPEFFWTVYAD